MLLDAVQGVFRPWLRKLYTNTGQAHSLLELPCPPKLLLAHTWAFTGAEALARVGACLCTDHLCRNCTGIPQYFVASVQSVPSALTFQSSQVPCISSLPAPSLPKLQTEPCHWPASKDNGLSVNPSSLSPSLLARSHSFYSFFSFTFLAVISPNLLSKKLIPEPELTSHDKRNILLASARHHTQSLTT